SAAASVARSNSGPSGQTRGRRSTTASPRAASSKAGSAAFAARLRSPTSRRPRQSCTRFPHEPTDRRERSMNQTLAVDERIEVARDYVRVVFNGHRPDLASDYCTDDVVWHGNSLGEVSGVDNLTGLLTAFLG